jgi:hypothetical protein
MDDILGGEFRQERVERENVPARDDVSFDTSTMQISHMY